MLLDHLYVRFSNRRVGVAFRLFTASIARSCFSSEFRARHTTVVENTPKLHNMVVCTLCSCYPWPVLGLPPIWYKSGPYRSRAVTDPRGVLRDFGVELPDDTEILVWDSTAEMRYLVLPCDRSARKVGARSDSPLS